MCFRPADVDTKPGLEKCPECGRAVPNFRGVVLNECPVCKCDFKPYLDGTKAVPAAAPSAPAAPGAPQPPAAPGAPQPPAN